MFEADFSSVWSNANPYLGYKEKQQPAKRSRSKPPAVTRGSGSSAGEVSVSDIEMSRSNKARLKELLQARYPLTFILDALACCTLATLLIYYAPVHGSSLYAVAAGFFEAKLGLIAHEASHGGAPRWLGWLYDCAMGSRSQWIVKVS
jgi:hypothetical protein